MELEPEWFEEELPGKSAKTVEIDRDTLIKLAQIGCTYDEMGKFFGCHSSTVRDRFSTLVNQVKAHTRARLRQAQIDLAIEKQDKTMLIWLGKQFLHQTENGERNSDDRQPLPWTDADLPEIFTVAEAPDETNDTASTSSDQ